MSYTIYKLSDPRTNLIHHVGVTKNVHKRYAQHLLFPHTNEAKGDWLLNLEQDGLMPVIEIVERDLSWEVARKREQYWIKYYRSQNAPLTNAVTGPHGHRLPKPQQEEYGIRLEAVRKALKAQGWSCLQRIRKDRIYIYAARKVGGKREECYIGPLESLKTLTAKSLSDKLTKKWYCPSWWWRIQSSLLIA
jgi:hypothetical protein